MRNQTVQKYWAVGRDAASFGLGTFVILHQEITQHVNLDLLLVALTLLGTPGAIALVQLFRGSVEPTRTTEQLGQHPEQPSPQQPSQQSLK